MTPGVTGLVLVETGGTGRELRVPASGQVVIGAHPSRAGLLLTAEGVADEHLRIGSLVGGGWALRDLGSDSGTEVNGSRVRSKRIVHGDRIQLGSVELLVIDESLAPTPKTNAPELEPEPALDEIELPTANPSDEDRPPRRIAGYRIVRPLGRGAFGHVLLAIQESLERETALKLLSPKLEGNAEFVRRFQEEARAAASLSHPNVVTVYDVGEDDGHHFLSMEFMAHGSLESRLRREGQLPPSEVIPIMIDATRGLVYAEQRAIVHRDIKPANLMLSEAGVTKISDLGLAVSLDAATQAEAHGTPHFVSPEQARGEAIDHRSDLYSLGATAFRLLTGHTPFEGQSTREILAAVFNETPPLASKLAPETPRELAELIASLLAKDPGQRPQSARELLAELEHMNARGLRAEDLPQSPAPRRTLFKLTLAVALLAAVAFGTRWFLERPGEEVEDRTAAAAESGSRVTPPIFDDQASQSETPVEMKAGERAEGGPPSSALGLADDNSLALLEAEANEALGEIDEQLEVPAQAESLRWVSETYRGTDAAVAAEQRLAELQARQAGIASHQSKAELDRNTTLAALRLELRLAADDFDVTEALATWSQFSTPLTMLGDETFAAQLSAVEGEIIGRALNDAQAAVDRANGHAAAGEFENARAALQLGRDKLNGSEPGSQDPSEAPVGFEGRFVEEALPAESEEALSAALETLRAADQRLSERIEQLADDELAFLAALDAADRQRCVRALHAGAGLELELSALDFQAVERRLTDVAESLEVEQHRLRIRALNEDVVAFKDALAALAHEYESGHWRRRALVDPREQRSKNRQVVGTSEAGWLIATESSPRQLPNSALVRSTSALDGLFNARIQSDYSPAQLRGIAFGMRLAAVLETLDLLNEAFAAQPPSLEEDQLDSFTEPYQRALEWAERAGDRAPARREQVTAQRILAALVDSADAGWTSAIRELDAAIREGEGSLLLLLLDDERAN